MSDSPMMTCGHTANAVMRSKGGVKYDPPLPCCAICTCTEIDESPPDLSERRARCTYYGKVPSGRSHESNYGCKRGEACNCEQPSQKEEGHGLPFFKHCPDKPYDEFYCGCWGWD